MADKECRVKGQFTTLPNIGKLSQCVPLNQCGKVLDNDYAPQNQTLLCGFDEGNKLLMVCCPDIFVTKPKTIEQKPRFPANMGKLEKLKTYQNCATNGKTMMAVVRTKI